MPSLPDKTKCVGCTSCACSCPKKCITFFDDEFGFRYPAINDNACVDCKLCEESCPVINYKIDRNEMTTAYAAKSKNDRLRSGSSSGGVFSELAILVLQQGGEVYGAAYDENFNVVHKCVSDLEELDALEALRGAKYAQSELKDTFLIIEKSLIEGKTILFAGTPCQVAGLKIFLKSDYENLICLDFICHGVSSTQIWKAYLKYIQKKYLGNKSLTFINMRDKTSGWSNYSYSHLFVSNNKKTFISNKDSLFMKLLVENSINRESCGNCQFKGYQRISEITLGDFWGIWEHNPEFDDNKGVSAVLIHNSKGKKLFESCISNLYFIQMDIESVGTQNSSLLFASKENPNRQQVIRTIIDKGFISLITKPNLFSRIKQRIEQKKGKYL